MIQAPLSAGHTAPPETPIPIAWSLRNSSVIGAGLVELENLSRFEGEGGLATPFGGGPAWAANQTNQQQMPLRS